MDLENICPIVDTVTDLRIHDKRGVLRDLARRAARTRNVDDDLIFNALLKREELGSTGVGNGVAIPHVRLEQVKKPFGIMARLRHPIDFNAVDGQAVDLVCLVLLSKENDGAQLNALAGVARRLRIPDVLDDLRRAPNRVVLYNVMIGRTGMFVSGSITPANRICPDFSGNFSKAAKFMSVPWAGEGNHAAKSKIALGSRAGMRKGESLRAESRAMTSELAGILGLTTAAIFAGAALYVSARAGSAIFSNSYSLSELTSAATMVALALRHVAVCHIFGKVWQQISRPSGSSDYKSKEGSGACRQPTEIADVCAKLSASRAALRPAANASVGRRKSLRLARLW